MADAQAVLDALGEPSRRRLLELLSGGERTVRELTDKLPVSQPAVSQHLRVLREAHLVAVRADGARRLYRIDPTGLGDLRAYVDQFWDGALSAFADFATASEPPPEPPPETRRDPSPRPARRARPARTR
jgi:DNA-binding transcriptional ArsR family regulator